MYKKTFLPAFFLFLFLFLSFTVKGQEAQETILPPLKETPDFVKELLSVAIEELGYEEGKDNYSKYGLWSGDPHAQWCAEFLCWSVDQVDQRFNRNLLKNQYPLYSSSNTGRDWFINKGRYVDRRGILDNWGIQWLWGEETRLYKNDYIPQPGDWMFFTWRQGPDTDHVAMVEYCSLNPQGEVMIHVIEGNNPSSVARNIYPLTDSNILGFGTVSQIVGTTIRFGNQGLLVSQLQQKLCDLGYLQEKYISGIFKSSTRDALNRFQEDFNPEKVNGVANLETQYALEKAWQKWNHEDVSEYVVVEDYNE